MRITRPSLGNESPMGFEDLSQDFGFGPICVLKQLKYVKSGTFYKMSANFSLLMTSSRHCHILNQYRVVEI